MPLNFALLDSPWDALSLQANIDAYLNAIPSKSWPNWVVGGHDKKRIASKIGQAQARNLAMLLLTLKGTPILFAGDELGMEQIDIPPDRIQDPFEKLVPGYSLNRDPERSPMRWDNSRNAGFTTGEPWLPMGSEIAERNVERLKCGSRSLLILYRSLITLRKQWPALTEGEYEPIRSRNDILVFKRIGPDSLLIALNLTHEPRRLEWSGSGTLLLSTYLDDAQVVIECPRLLRADEGIIVKLR